MSDFNEYQILEYAICREEHAYNFYKALAEHMAYEELTNIFEELAQEELEHKKQLELEIIKLGHTIETDRPHEKFNIAEFGLKEGHKLQMSLEDALTIAIEKEELSFRFYVEHEAMLKRQEAKEVMLALAEEEARHKLYFEKELETLRNNHRSR